MIEVGTAKESWGFTGGLSLCILDTYSLTARQKGRETCRAVSFLRLRFREQVQSYSPSLIFSRPEFSTAARREAAKKSLQKF